MPRKITLHAFDLAHAFGYLFDGEVFALLALAASLPNDAKMVNIGAGAGTSAMCLREGCPEAEIFTIDISEGGPYGGLENERNTFDQVGLKIPNQILCDSNVVGTGWHYGDVDLVFVDGDHSYQGCMGDIKAWWKNLKVGGYMVLHDYTRAEWPDVKRAVDTHVEESGAQVVLHVDTLIIIKKV